jgi:hypothetical protein
VKFGTWQQTIHVHHLHVFGYVVFIHVPKETNIKLDSKIVKCTFINYGDLRLKGTNCTTLYGNMLSLIMMSSFKSPKFLMGKICFMFGFLTKLNGF